MGEGENGGGFGGVRKDMVLGEDGREFKCYYFYSVVLEILYR